MELEQQEQLSFLSTAPVKGDPINILYSGETGMVEAWAIGSGSEHFITVSYDPESLLFTRTTFCQIVNEEVIYRQDLYEAYLAKVAKEAKRKEAEEYIAYATPLINRHRDELELGDPTTLTTAEYRDLLRKRNEAVTTLNSTI